MEARVLDRFPAEVEAFRSELRGWLDENLTDDIRQAGSDNGGAPNTDALEVLRKWQHALADAGYAAIAWPKEYGGGGAGGLGKGVHPPEKEPAPGPVDPK